jgi:transglutaminase-like putative cysteine protease
MATRAPELSVERFYDFSLLGLAACGFLAVVGSGYLDSPTIAFTAAALLLRALAIADFIPVRISNRAVTVACIVCLAAFPVDYVLLSRKLADATVHMVFFLAALKILTAETRRDHAFLAFISFAELVAGAIFSINLNFFVFLALYLFFAMAALTSGEIRRSLRRGGIRARSGVGGFHPRLAALATFVTAGILLLTAGLFFLLPRTADAALSRFLPHDTFVAGFSNHIMLGQTGTLLLNARPVMHITSPRPDKLAGVKWRGDAVTHFNGREWTNPKPNWQPVGVYDSRGTLTPSDPRPPGRYVTWEARLDIDDAKALFMAGAPQVVSMNYETLDRSDTDGYRLGEKIPEGFRYTVYSLLEEPPEARDAVYEIAVLDPESRARDLELPRLDPRIGLLAHSIIAGAPTDVARARAIERYLRSNYTYSLEMPLRQPADPLSDFLFTRRRGYCEYFASAMAVMLRTVAIPARVATGFQSGVYNSLTGQWVIRASDAHAWVEAWMPGRGWTTFDPTPADPNARFGLMSRLNLYLDAAGSFWQEWVVGYDPRRQGTLAGRLQAGASFLGFHWASAAWRTIDDDLKAAAPWVQRRSGILAALVGAALALWFAIPAASRSLSMRRRVARARRGEASAQDAALLYQRMLRTARKLGYQKPAWFTPAEFAASLPPGGFSASVSEFTDAYNALRFGKRNEGARLSLLLEQMERAGK